MSWFFDPARATNCILVLGLAVAVAGCGEEKQTTPVRTTPVRGKGSAGMELPELIARHNLSRVSDQLTDMAGDSIVINTRPLGKNTPTIGASRIGGTPDFLPGTDWPKWKGTPLSFIAQINMADVAPYKVSSALPKSGMLYFFYDSKQDTWGFDPADRGSWKVIFAEGPLSDLRRTVTPFHSGKEGLFAACTLTFSKGKTVQPWESSEIEKLNLSDTEFDEYLALNETLQKVQGAEGHWMLGHPDLIQGEMQLQCQLASNGLYCGDESGYNDPRASALEPGARDWQLLLQIESDEDAGMMWGDSGRLYFWIKEEDLKAQKFENVWMVLQCF